MARNGKVARLSYEVREEINQRLRDNQNGATILRWINEKCRLRGAAAITDNNLSQWRSGGFVEWMEKQEKVEKTRSLAEYCRRVADAGGGSMDLPAAVAGGQLMEILEEFDPADLKLLLREKPETYLGILERLSSLRSSAATETKLKQAEKKLDQADEKLAQSKRLVEVAEIKAQTQACIAFLKWREDKRVEEIAASGGKQTVKVEQLRALIFGAVTNKPLPKTINEKAS